MQVELRPEREFYEDQAGGVSRALMGLAGFVAVVMASAQCSAR